MDYYSNNGVDFMVNIFLFFVVLISEKCIYFIFDVINVFLLFVNYLVFIGSYLFIFVERGIVR